VLRVLNEERHLDELLRGIRAQRVDIPVEVVIVDSGSTDRTLDIARAHQCRIEHIRMEDFTFGRSLNVGCRAARGDWLVFVSGHCIPADDHWLAHLVAPLLAGEAAYSYGRQVGGEGTKFSERQLFAKYFPVDEALAQGGFFCNNANAALAKAVWEQFRFDEELTGLEDMELAKRLVGSGRKVAYAPTSTVLHLHDETWRQVKRRYEREAFALRKIMPEIHVDLIDVSRYLVSSVWYDLKSASSWSSRFARFFEIVAFRAMQYWGTFRGNQSHRELSRKLKEKYFYPKLYGRH
jgi:glycosyltransferase involved in cell wall biosynthesis